MVSMESRMTLEFDSTGFLTSQLETRLQATLFLGTRSELSCLGLLSKRTLFREFGWYDINGDFAVPNFNDGIMVLGGAHNNSIGGVVLEGLPGNFPGNVISGNGGNGIYIEFSESNDIQGNLIGVSTAESDGVFTTSIPNGRNGVHLLNSSFNLVGGPDAGARNIISSNTDNGVLIEDLIPASYNTVQGNYIGVGLLSFETEFGNGANGVAIQNSDNNTVASNVISGNLSNGVYLSGYGAFDNSIVGNRIGTDASGQFEVGNQADGVRLENAHDNTIGGIVPEGAQPGTFPGNIIVGSDNGIGVFDSLSLRLHGDSSQQHHPRELIAFQLTLRRNNAA